VTGALQVFDLIGENPPMTLAQRHLRRLAEPYVFFPLIALVLLAVVWGTTADMIGVERTLAQRSALSSTQELANTYEAQVGRALREIDHTMRLVKYAWERGGGRVDLAQLRDKALLLPDLVFSVSIADASGNVVASSHPGGTRNISDRDYFVEARDSDNAAIGRPRLDPADHEWKLDFGRRLQAPDGSFAGVVTISVAASFFVVDYDPARLGNHGVLAMLGADGVFRVRRTGDAISIGGRGDYAAIVPAGDPDAPPALATNPWDGVKRYTSARPLFGFPLAVIVGLDRDEQLAATNQRIRDYLWRAAGGSLALTLLLGGLGWLSWRLSRTRIMANRALQEEIRVRRGAERALNLRNRAIESSVNAILITDFARPGFPIDYVNPAFERITGYAAREALGRGMDFLLGAELEQPGIAEIRMALRERREGHAVLRNYRKDGTPFWNEYTVAPVRNESGEVTHYVGVMNDVTDAKNYEEQLARQANFDTLTGLANRNLLRDRLQQGIVRAKRENAKLAVLFLDVDQFKIVNDSLGHTVGDELLKTVAGRLSSSVRESDTVARLGGDEFVVVLVTRSGEASLEVDVTTVAAKLLGNVAEPVVLGERELRPTISVGVSVYPQDGADVDTLLRNADAAMYRAKELGRNRFQFFTADMHERIRRRVELESSLRRALERGEFELHYQPQVGLREGRIVGVEALLRWRHPERGLIGPAHFIGFAEESGLIVPIGAWVIEEACRQNKAWQDQGLPPIPVAVNVSARQCEQENIDDVVRDALRRSGLSPRWLELEITESISMANPEQSVPLMRRLKETGVALSIDDFGTGFSNLSYLKRFPIDRLKIDLSFVREITSDPGSLAISEAIITLSHSLNLKVLAEGVETDGQLTLLAARQCDEVQGFLFSPPVPAARVGELLGGHFGFPRPGAAAWTRKEHHANPTPQ
jgi:diguanylate cyclase (GGDEF)-like protein/PAS domain S-box-containing protein